MKRYRITVAAAGAALFVVFWAGPGCYRSAANAPAPLPRTERTTEAAPSPGTTAGPEAGPLPRSTPPPETAALPPAPTKESGEPVRAGNGPEPEAGSGAPAEPPEGVSSPRPTAKPTGAGAEAAGADLPSTEAAARSGPAPGTAEPALPGDAPLWVREGEELVYRVEFLGLTMGYARFRSQGVVRIGDRPAYRLTVRAWTTDLLSVFYPMNDTIEYYLDVETLAPIRQEFTNSRSEDDIADYDQQAGTIVYRYRKSGKVRKEVRAVPGVYDPVSVTYYFRGRDLSAEEPARPMYAGRKLWEVSAKRLGTETIRTDGGRFDTVMIEPVLRRDGNQEHKGNLRIWMTRDARHVPVRLYAKFKKVRTWTLVGELVPGRQGG